MGSTTYETLYQTLTLTNGVNEDNIVYAFPPQNTPFTPPSGECAVYPRAIRCLGKLENVDARAECLGDQYVYETTVSLPTQCFPESYNEIWRPLGTKFVHLPSLAYPGTACISGWTTDCTKTLTMTGGKTFVQTWCCPPGGWTCLSVPKGETPYRDCVSLLSTPTEIWVNNLATTSGKESTLYSSWRKVSISSIPDGTPLRISHPVFPLYGRDPNAGNETAAGETGLAGGAVAGIAVGAAVAVLALVGIAVFVCLRKRKQRRAALAAQSEAAAAERDPYYKGAGYDTKQELPGHGSETRELRILSASPVELSSQTRLAEVEGNRPVELAS
ncbi:hypothetical protein CSOJ01_03746 [Colletotrichum sojae]|uniref:Uncharacterized protein n=1 Tax=Colletotrichum sojae TaxID=2175907 RepID=A0A8H6JLR7_9PEZI|nr:hypothetical protein CSOJ01_03746 [Colletotrichum sojae]